MVKLIRDENQNKEKAKEDRKSKKHLDKEAFYKCKEKCENDKCDAIKLKGSSCHDILIHVQN